MDENSNKCIQYLGVVHNWRNISGGHLNKSDLLPQCYEYPNGKHTIWRRIEGISFVSAHMALCYNEFCCCERKCSNAFSGKVISPCCRDISLIIGASMVPVT